MIGITELLEIAIEIEEKGYSYYSKLADRSPGYNKVLFESLARQEKEHVEWFRDLMKEYKDEQTDAVPYEIENADFLKSLAEISIFSFEDAEKVIDDLEKAVKAAVQIEKDTIEFYKRLVEYIPKKRLLERIIREEERHLEELSKAFRNYV
ncbi:MULTISPECIES: ferritin-like domain-containing protein [Kosmotoga]|uniref:Rubrerythrin n=1 Tax=Kosmotoga olearia (strain ATCC BAA-1733 / DSM 21960 / TBF 19.5.1) TaxID=521045 RepID=C5CIA3_KOSOT|nr:MULTISPECIES: ferritin family protein [Kosmotoga]ACR80805.1 Rubrerythrin [Kosmotoga olearia TBF 19.5.1]MDI3523975.1 hypothetical protein [Kosmotoga sp.]MDK2952712.1 hypothetical protein [Kosmotoga sp.]